MPTHVTSKGQVTIPKPIRDLLAITTAVEFTLDHDGRVIMTRADPTPPSPSRFAQRRGAAGPGLSTDEIIHLTRGEA